MIRLCIKCLLYDRPAGCSYVGLDLVLLIVVYIYRLGKIIPYIISISSEMIKESASDSWMRGTSCIAEMQV